MKEIVLASSNPGKVREINQLLATLELQVRPQSEFGVVDAEETGLSFVENAILKARNAAQHTGLPAIADDSGIEVDALHGAPGIYSARFAGEGATDQANLDKLLAELDGLPEAQRSARFQCLMVFMEHANDPTPLICQGTWEGRILLARNAAWTHRMFALITGFMEAGESPEDGIRRELAEETGLSALETQLVGVHEFLRMNQVIITYHVRARGEVRLSPELAEYKLFALEDLRRLLMKWATEDGFNKLIALARAEIQIAVGRIVSRLPNLELLTQNPRTKGSLYLHGLEALRVGW